MNLRIAVVALSACACARAQTSSPPSIEFLAPTFGGEKAFCRASRDSTLAFTFPAEIAEVFVRGGERVRRGDVLVRAFDLEYRYQRDTQKLVADSDLDVLRAQAQLDQAKIELEAIEQMRRPGLVSGGSPVELERAKAQVQVRAVELDIARLQQTQNRLQLSFREAQVERFRLCAPFDGIVDQVLVDIGEVKKDAEPVMRVVNTDPLWVDVPTPTGQTILLRLKPGDPAWVLPDLPGEPRVFVGKVIELGAQADPRANTRRVRVELPNPEGWPAGLWCWTRFTEPTGEWGARIVEARPAELPAAESPVTRSADAGARR